MRVIAGTYRSRPLISPRGTLTRPTSDRLRETLFNILQSRILGARFADLYAGTGAVGIEALSRGASHVLFAERAAPALATLRSNLQALRIVSGFTIEPRSSISAIERLLETPAKSPAAAPLDLVFLDPPYESAGEYTAALTLLGSANASGLLAATALVIAEHSSKSPLAERVGDLHQLRYVRQGDAALTFFSRPKLALS